MSCQIPKERIDAVIAFHGHSCPGLAIGIRAAELALSRLNNPTNTQIVAVVETDMCGVDAIQFLTGATLGKGNLIHRDYGKMAFSFFHRDTGAGFRAVLDPEARGGMDVEMAELMKKQCWHSHSGRYCPHSRIAFRVACPIYGPAFGKNVSNHRAGAGNASISPDFAKSDLCMLW